MEKLEPGKKARRWTAAERSQWVREYRASGLTQEKFAAERQLNVGTLRGWLYRRRPQTAAGVGGFASVKVIGGRRPGVSSAVTVRLGHGVEVEVAVELDAAGVTRLVRELVGPCSR